MHGRAAVIPVMHLLSCMHALRATLLHGKTFKNSAAQPPDTKNYAAQPPMSTFCGPTALTCLCRQHACMCEYTSGNARSHMQTFFFLRYGSTVASAKPHMFCFGGRHESIYVYIYIFFPPQICTAANKCNFKLSKTLAFLATGEVPDKFWFFRIKSATPKSQRKLVSPVRT